MKIQTIDVIAKEWFDNGFGNSYFAGTVTINNATETEETFLMPFQYGYGSQYEQEAKNILTEFNKISANYGLSLYSYCKENDITLNISKQDDCKRIELTRLENNYNNNLNKVA
jgi:hypothetical protein